MYKEEGAETFVMFNTDARQHWICMLNFSSFLFGQGPTLTETINETVTSFYFKVSILHYVQTNPVLFETTYFLTRNGLASTRNQWIRSQKPPLSRAVKDPVRVHTSLLESSSNARLWGGALRDDTKNRCVTHKSAFPVYPAGSETVGVLYGS